MIRPLLTTALFVCWQTSAAEFWISPSGNDANPGTESKPFASLEKARDSVRQSKEQGNAQTPVTVWLRSGDYLRTNTLELSSSDSGTVQSPILWRAFDREPVRLLGGRLLTGFTPVTNTLLLARLDKNARNHVVQLNLRDLGLTNFGELKSRGFGRASAPSHCELFFNHKPMTLARWPNEGQFARIDSATVEPV